MLKWISATLPLRRTHLETQVRIKRLGTWVASDVDRSHHTLYTHSEVKPIKLVTRMPYELSKTYQASSTRSVMFLNLQKDGTAMLGTGICTNAHTQKELRRSVPISFRHRNRAE